MSCLVGPGNGKRTFVGIIVCRVATLGGLNHLHVLGLESL